MASGGAVKKDVKRLTRQEMAGVRNILDRVSSLPLADAAEPAGIRTGQFVARLAAGAAIRRLLRTRGAK